MSETGLLESFWPADTARPILDVSIGSALAATTQKVPDRTANVSGSSDRFIAHCRAAMAHHKAHTLWFVCNEFPLTASGKVQKFRLREALAEGSLSRLD